MKRTERNTYQLQLLATLLLLITAFVLSACSSDDTNTTPNAANDSEIRFDVGVWNMMEGTRATFYDTGTSLASGSFICYAFNANSTTPYINQTTVNYTAGQWTFEDGKHYWPADASLDFFAYMPKEESKPSYITSGPTYSVSGTPQATFTCSSMPMSYDASSPTAGQGNSLQEFVWGITVGQNKENQGASGVTMKFCHPFARIRFQLSASHPNIQINSITFKNLKTGGTCILNATNVEETYYYKTSVWSSLTPAEGGSNFVMTLASKDNDGNYVAADVNIFNDNPTNVVPIGGYSGGAHQYVDLLMVPQTFGGEVVVNATWTDWGDQLPHNVTATVPTTWVAGRSYTYTFTISETDLKVDTEKFTEQW